MSVEIPVLETERLRLRPPRAGDAPRIQELAGDRLVAATTGNIPHPYPDGAAEKWISESPAGAVAGSAYTFVIAGLADDLLLGAVGLHPSTGEANDPTNPQRAELGYWVGVPYWGRGYVTEAALRVVAWGFEVLKLDRVYAVCLESNRGSSRVMEKIGMRHEGTLRHHLRKWGEVHDARMYGILRSEWEAGRAVKS